MDKENNKTKIDPKTANIEDDPRKLHPEEKGKA